VVFASGLITVMAESCYRIPFFEGIKGETKVNER
jgi:hypothetical protein